MSRMTQEERPYAARIAEDERLCLASDLKDFAFVDATFEPPAGDKSDYMLKWIIDFRSQKHFKTNICVYGLIVPGTEGKPEYVKDIELALDAILKTCKDCRVYLMGIKPNEISDEKLSAVAAKGIKFTTWPKGMTRCEAAIVDGNTFVFCAGTLSNFSKPGETQFSLPLSTQAIDEFATGYEVFPHGGEHLKLEIKSGEECIHVFKALKAGRYLNADVERMDKLCAYLKMSMTLEGEQYVIKNLSEGPALFWSENLRRCARFLTSQLVVKMCNLTDQKEVKKAGQLALVSGEYFGKAGGEPLTEGMFNKYIANEVDPFKDPNLGTNILISLLIAALRYENDAPYRNLLCTLWTHNIDIAEGQIYFFDKEKEVTETDADGNSVKVKKVTTTANPEYNWGGKHCAPPQFGFGPMEHAEPKVYDAIYWGVKLFYLLYVDMNMSLEDIKKGALRAFFMA